MSDDVSVTRRSTTRRRQRTGSTRVSGWPAHPSAWTLSWMRLLLAGCALVVAVSGCSGTPSTSHPPPSRSPFASVMSPAPTSPRKSSGSVSRIDCNVVGDSQPPADYTVIDDTVALFLGSTASPLTLTPDPRAESAVTRNFVKSGIGIRYGRSWRLQVADADTAHLRIGWGSPADPATTVLPPSCEQLTSPSAGWLWFPGGYWTDKPGCYSLTVEVDGRAHHLRLPLGTSCA